MLSRLMDQEKNIFNIILSVYVYLYSHIIYTETIESLCICISAGKQFTYVYTLVN